MFMVSKGHNRPRFLLLGGVIAPLILALIIVIAGHITRNYNPVSDTISKMGIPGMSHAPLLNGGYYCYGILMGLAALGLQLSLPPTPATRRLVSLIGVHAVGTIFLAVFPDSFNSPARHVTHDIASATGYLPLLAGMLVFYSLMRDEKAMKFVSVLALAVVLFNLPMPVINMLPPLKSISGLLQRLMFGGSFLWLTLTFLFIYIKTPPPPARHQLP
jgi:hypothetical membrane protein